MSVIEKIRQERKLDADYLEKRPQVLKLLVKELYANVAHFIIELLQNAEDVGATEVAFNLCPDELIFEHDGRPFEEADIWGITAIAESAKEEDENAIGRFGIGFKSVFSYTETPHIWSPTYSFKISKMVLPSELSKDSELGNRTRFKFPFNSRKKPRQAFSEIQNELEKISDSTLLFLPCVKKIQWQIANGRKGCLVRNLHSEQHIEICRQINGDPKKGSHFLRFTELADGFKNQHITVAFELAELSGNTRSNMRSLSAQQFSISPTEDGCIAVYFEIQKSNLRFHLHAPFDPTLARDRIKDTPLNEQLLQQLAKLVVRSLSTIRELGLLNRDFLAVLPNSQDNILAQCEPIREAVIDAMKKQPLTPKHVGGHAPASRLLQAEASLKNLLNHVDLRFLIGEHDDTRDWAIAAEKRGSDVDKFLQDLDIEQWNSRQFVQTLRQNLSRKSGLNQLFVDWMRRKPDEWHYHLYDFLQRQAKDELYWFEDICVVRCSDGEYRAGRECYFPTPEIHDDPIHPRVARNTFVNSKGKDKGKKSASREFLEGIGVREVGELEQIEAILEQQYTDPSHIPCWENYELDLRRFIELVEKNKDRNELFRDYFIFQRIDQLWSKPEGVYLDAPYQSTDLEAYYSFFGSESKRMALSNGYKNLDLRDRFIEFARACGVVDRLEIEKISCNNNPDKESLFNAPGRRWVERTGINCDFFIPGLKELFENPTLRLSRLIWNTLCDSSDRRDNIWQACFRWNGSDELRHAKSQLVHQLSAGKWIPQKSNTSSQANDPLTFVRPALALAELLPLPEEGFPFNPSWSWLEEIHFSKETGQHLGISELAGKLGLSGKDQLERAVKLVKQIDRLPLRVRQEIQQLLAEQENSVDLPQHRPIDQEQRSRQVKKRARQAPKYTREKRSRMILLGHSKVKEETRHYLRHRYTNSDKITICQICEKPLPFRRSDGHYFFVAVPFLPSLERNHYQNYLALCPLHAAMFLYANDSEKDLKDKLLALGDDDSRLEIVLAGEPITIYFVDSHILDLKDIIDVEDGK